MHLPPLSPRSRRPLRIAAARVCPPVLGLRALALTCALSLLLFAAGCDSGSSDDDAPDLRTYRVDVGGTPSLEATCSVILVTEGQQRSVLETRAIPFRLGSFESEAISVTCALDQSAAGEVGVRLFAGGEQVREEVQSGARAQVTITYPS